MSFGAVKDYAFASLELSHGSGNVTRAVVWRVKVKANYVADIEFAHYTSSIFAYVLHPVGIGVSCIIKPCTYGL